MKAAYFHCFAGISGDMTLGALVDAGLPLTLLEKELAKLNLANWQLAEEKVHKHGLQGTKVKVLVQEEKTHRHLNDILQIIENSSLPLEVQSLSRKIFYRLAQAEAKVHGVKVEEVHFHEVGALDSIIDIVGTAIGLYYLGIQKIYASKLHVGQGTIQCAHGLLPIPAPATMELLQGIPIYATEVEGELVTPTGAAILATLAQSFGAMPEMIVERTGYGAGEKNFPLANLLRVSIGELAEPLPYLLDEGVMLETNIDDLNPEIYDHLLQLLLQEGALDVFLQPIQMKKNRPGVMLRVLTTEEKVSQLSALIFQETSTLGLRITPVQRRILEREIISLETEYGVVGVKIGWFQGEVVNIAPEYDHCQKIAQENKLPLKLVYQEVLRAAQGEVKKFAGRKIKGAAIGGTERGNSSRAGTGKD